MTILPSTWQARNIFFLQGKKDRKMLMQHMLYSSLLVLTCRQVTAHGNFEKFPPPLTMTRALRRREM